jgi:hypothetical protein
VFVSKSPVLSSNNLWAWSFLHYRAYLHCHFSSLSFDTNETVSVASPWKGLFHFSWRSEELACMSHIARLILQKNILLYSFHLPLHTIHVFSSTHFLFILSPYQVLNQRCTSFSWSACHFHFTSSPTSSVEFLPLFPLCPLYLYQALLN